MNRSLVRIGLTLTFAVTLAGWAHAQTTTVQVNAQFGDALMLRDDNLNRPYVTEKIKGWNNVAYVTSSLLWVWVRYPGGSRYVVTDFSSIVPEDGSYFQENAQLPCNPMGTARPVQIAPPSFLLDADASNHVVQPPKPTTNFWLTLSSTGYRWELVDPTHSELGYGWRPYEGLDYLAMGDGEVRYAEMLVYFRTAETEAIGANAYLAFDAPRGVNSIGQVASVGKVRRVGNTWTVTPVPVEEYGSGGLVNLSYQLEPSSKPKRPGYHNCNLGWYSIPFELTLTAK